MKSLKLFFGFVSLVGALVSVDASADSAPVNCSWRTASVSSSGSGAIVTEICSDTGVDVVSTTKGYGQSLLVCYSNVLKTGYSYSGTCGSSSVVVYKQSASSCGVNAGKSYGVVTVGMYQGTVYQFPTSSVNAYCGACGYETTSVGGTGAYSQLSVTCKK